MSRLARYAAIAIATLLAVVVLFQFRGVLALLILSLAVAAAIRPAVDRLEDAGLSRALAGLLLVALALLGLAAVFLLLGSRLIGELLEISNDAARAYELLYPRWLQGSAAQQAIAGQLPTPERLVEGITGQQGERLAGSFLGFTRGVVGLAAAGLAILVLSIYWTADRDRFEQIGLSLQPGRYRAQARAIWRRTEQDAGAYLRSEFVQGLVAIFLLYAGYAAFGLPHPTTLAVLAAIAWLIPLAGGIIIVVAVLIFSLAQGLAVAGAALIYSLAVLFLLEFGIEPRLFNRFRYSPVLTVLMMLVLIQDFGLLGLIVAPPVAATVNILAEQIFSRATAEVAPESERSGRLRQRYAKLQAELGQLGPAAPPELLSLAGRLGRLLQEVEGLMPAQANRVEPEEGQLPLPDAGVS
ncbi:MAG: AI-2E family transporter [Candidatus Promineifilaceae bacterium]